MQPAPVQFVSGELEHLHRLQGSAYTAGGQVWKGRVLEGTFFLQLVLQMAKNCSDMNRLCGVPFCECLQKLRMSEILNIDTGMHTTLH